MTYEKNTFDFDWLTDMGKWRQTVFQFYEQKIRKYGFIDKGKNVIVPAKYDDVPNKFSEGLRAVKLDKNWGYIDQTGKEVISLIYDLATEFSKGKALVHLGNQVGNIDKFGVFSPFYKQGQEEIKILCENLQLSTYMKSINEYKKSTPFAFGFLKIKSPYIIVRNIYQDDRCQSMHFVEYSEGKFDEVALNDLKTVIIEYEYLDKSTTYRYANKQGSIF